ncbi:phosphoribosylanthranilate isomerase [Candidatus Magnetaquicoccus inordinatus]|uniref:phosphoribosylanthranilate isomerase n=1 Tax=Candidatus Magnetaquicoccus inordinatus TaxID=2496818 RepID=UPI003B968353
MATRIKVCGITRHEDAVAAAAVGVDALGLVFYPRSARFVTPQRAAAIANPLPPFLIRVGLFVNAPLTEIMAILSLGFLHSVQLHGDETIAECAQLRLAIQEAGLSVSLIKALRIATKEDLPDPRQWPVDALLLDAKVSGHYGGSGQSFTWSVLDREWRNMAQSTGKPFILAGGLTPDNVAAAITQVRPYAVDLSTGVESAPGIKEEAAMKRLVQQVRLAEGLL